VICILEISHGVIPPCCATRPGLPSYDGGGGDHVTSTHANVARVHVNSASHVIATSIQRVSHDSVHCSFHPKIAEVTYAVYVINCTSFCTQKLT
jgi:N-methylhydantoinase A/oxoprolinase/acetone carboxylase beta subunit